MDYTTPPMYTPLLLAPKDGTADKGTSTTTEVGSNSSSSRSDNKTIRDLFDDFDNQRSRRRQLHGRTSSTGESSTDDSYRGSISCWENFVTFVFLPLLLVAQFGLLFVNETYRTQHLDPRLEFGTILYSIALFVICCALYRNAVIECNMDQYSVVIVLLPEIIMDIVLGLILFDRVYSGFLFLLISTLVLSMFVVVSSLYLLYIAFFVLNDDDDDDDEDDDEDVEQQRQYILQVTDGDDDDDDDTKKTRTNTASTSSSSMNPFRNKKTYKSNGIETAIPFVGYVDE